MPENNAGRGVATPTETFKDFGYQLKTRQFKVKSFAQRTVCRKRLFSLALEKTYSGLHDYLTVIH